MVLLTAYCCEKKDDGQYEVIDGQQRLTTIYLILKFLSSRFRDPKKLFNLNYETRENSSSFLINLQQDDSDNSNVDFYCISEAYRTICEWFSRPNFNINDF